MRGSMPTLHNANEGHEQGPIKKSASAVVNSSNLCLAYFLHVICKN